MFTFNFPLTAISDAAADEVKDLLREYDRASSRGPVRGGVVSDGEAAAYALVWEWGNARQTKQGPKTVMGINPEGDAVWLSSQAPMGYIRINEPEFINILMNQLNEIDLEKAKLEEEILKAIKAASRQAGVLVAEIIRENAPIDTGALRESIQAADPDDPDLAVEEEDVELGTAHFAHVVREQLKRLK